MFSELCTPAKIYFVFALIGIVLHVITMFEYRLYDMYSIVSFIITIALNYAWLMLLQYCCNREMELVAWLLLFFPFVIFFFFMFFMGSLLVVALGSGLGSWAYLDTPIATLLPTLAPTPFVTTIPTIFSTTVPTPH